ncbi:LytR C-terminal domain-containing protein [Nocardioides sp. P5_C9_2]
MRDGVRSALTLGGLCLLMLAAGAWGWKALTQPLPDNAPAPLCTDTTVAAGTPVFRDQVAVSVFNASSRSGLAGATLELLEDRGFVGADTGNAPEPVRRVQIWAADPQNPAVRLVKRQFRKAQVVAGTEVDGEPLGRGVVVVLGQSYSSLREKEIESVKARTDATFCSPPGS